MASKFRLLLFVGRELNMICVGRSLIALEALA